MLFRLWSNKNNLSNQRNFQANDDWNWYCTSFVTLPWLVEKRLALPFNQSDYLIFPPWSLDQLSLSTGDLFLSSDWLLSIVVSHLSVHDLLKPPYGWLAWELSTFCDADMDQVWKRIWQSLQSKRVYLWIYQRWTLRIESKDWVLRK